MVVVLPGGLGAAGMDVADAFGDETGVARAVGAGMGVPMAIGISASSSTGALGSLNKGMTFSKRQE